MTINKRVMDHIEDVGTSWAMRVATRIAEHANALSPTDTNRHPSHKGKRRLKGSFRAVKRGREAAVVSSTKYGMYVEYGVPGRTTGTGMLRKAVDLTHAEGESGGFD